MSKEPETKYTCQMDGIKALFAEVIMSAVEDFKRGTKANRKSAEEFLRSKWLDFYCDPLDISPNKIRQVLEG